MRYYRLLPPSGLYSQSDILVQSSAAERCIMSAQGVLAGFMPPLEHYNVLPIDWQPIPVNILPRTEDIILAQKKPCLKYDEILSKMYKSPPKNIQKINEDNADLYRLLTKHTRRNISNVLDVELLYNILDIEEKAGLVLPDWTENIFPDRLLPLAERSYTLFTETSLMKKVRGGALLTEVLGKMEGKKLKLNPDRKIFLYSAHDVTMVNVMNSMGILDQTANLPEHSSALVFELHHSSLYKDDFEVKIVYFFNSDDKFPKELDIPYCDSPCSLTNFRKSIEHLIMSNYDETCENVPTCKN